MNNYANEHEVYLAIELLTNIGQNFTIEKFFNTVMTDFDFDEAAFLLEKKRELEVIEKVKSKAVSIISEKEIIDFYFGNIKIGDTSYESIRDLVLLWSTVYKINRQDINTFCDKLTNLPDKEYYKLFGSSLQMYNNLFIKSDDSSIAFNNEADVLSFILNMNIPNEIKWTIQDLFINRKEHQSRVLSLVKKAVEVIHMFDAEINEVVTKFYAYWEKEIGDQDIQDYLRQTVPIFYGLEKNPLGINVFPSLFLPYHTSLSTQSDEQTEKSKSPTMLVVGVLIGDCINPRFFGRVNSISLDSSINTIKLLSDKSRFDILMYISKKEAYGAEIAEHLGLTTATVSHHLGLLVEAKLVTMSRGITKIYYSINKECLKKHLDFIRKELTV